MKIMKKSDKYFKTSDFSLACYLLYVGLELSGIDKTNPQRALFTFRDTPDRGSYVRTFLFGNPQIDAKRFIYCQKELKNKLYSNYF